MSLFDRSVNEINTMLETYTLEDLENALNNCKKEDEELILFFSTLIDIKRATLQKPVKKEAIENTINLTPEDKKVLSIDVAEALKEEQIKDALRAINDYEKQIELVETKNPSTR